MLQWSRKPAEGEFEPTSIYDGTVISLIKIYLNDPDSPFHALRYRVKLAYESKLRTIAATVGEMNIPALCFRDFKRWHKNYCRSKQEGGPPRPARGHAIMTQIRLLMEFGKLLRLTGCKEASESLSGMRFRNPKKRTVFMTAEQAIAIRREAHKQGRPSIALAQALMFDLMFRQKDVIGETIPNTEPGLSEVIFGDRAKWLYGMHWSEIDESLILRHRLSKSLKGRDAILDPTAGKLEEYDLKVYPMVMEEIQHVKDLTGPVVIREETGLPWDHKSFSRAWRKIARLAGVPDEVQNRDSRAGAVTEALDSGANLDQVRRHAGHSRQETTIIYARDSLKAKAEVIDIRKKNRPKTA